MHTTFSTARKKLNSLEALIGNTPLVSLERVNPNPMVRLLAKLEAFNPSGSIKDRIVLHILNDAKKRGLLKKNSTIIENTSGNTGASVAMLAAAWGYKALLTLPDKVSLEKQNALTAFGAELVVCPTSAPSGSPDHYVTRAIEIAKNTPDSFRINQYDNPLNPEAHYLTTAPEIWEQSGFSVDYFVASASTGGTISGIGKYLKEKNKNVQVIMPDPVGSVFFTYFKTKKVPKDAACTYFLEGIGEDHITGAIDFSVIDDVVPVTDKASFEMCRRLAKEEGIVAGGSSGANLLVALELAKRQTEPKTIVTIFPDAGTKYLSKIYNPKWLEEHKLL